MARPCEFEKEKVIDKAMRLFWEKGYLATSAQDLTVATGLSRSSLYHTYDDKRSLFMACLRQYISDQSLGLLEAVSLLPHQPDSIRKLLNLVVEDTLAQAQHPLGCLVVNTVAELGDSDPDIADILRQNTHEVIKAFHNFLQTMQDNGSLGSKVPPMQLATLLFHEMTAIRLTSKIIRDRNFFQNGIDAYMQLIQY